MASPNGRTSHTASPASCRRRGSSTRSTTGKLRSKRSELRRLPARSAYRVRLSRESERGMYNLKRRRRRNPSTQARLRRAEPERMDQGGLLRPERRRHLLLLEVPDQRRRVRRRRRHRSRSRDSSIHHRRRHQLRHAAAGKLPSKSAAGAELVSGRVQTPDTARASTRSGSRRGLCGGLPGQPRHRRPGTDHLPLGHAGSGWQRRRVDRHDHPVAVGQERRTDLAPAARRHLQRPRDPALALGGRPAAREQRASSTARTRGWGSGSAWSAT